MLVLDVEMDRGCRKRYDFGGGQRHLESHGGGFGVCFDVVALGGSEFVAFLRGILVAFDIVKLELWKVSEFED